MKVIFIIDNLDSGGAERQCAVLARKFAAEGHSVAVFGYAPGEFYLPVLEEAGVEYRCFPGLGPARRILAFRREIRRRAPDAVIALMQTPAVLAELAGVPRRRWRLVVSERGSIGAKPPARTKLVLSLHRLADAVTTNSYRNAAAIAAAVPALGPKTATVYNLVNLNAFRPAEAPPRNAPLRLIALGTHTPNKNAARLVEALAGIPEESRPHLDWYGRQEGAFHETVRLAEKLGVAGSIAFHAPVTDIAEHLRRADALVHPALSEGLPNAVCEAMACGIPVLMGRGVSDAEVLAEEGGNGLLFDPHSAGSIRETVVVFCALSAEARGAMGRAGRRRAEALFGEEEIFRSYLELAEGGGR